MTYITESMIYGSLKYQMNQSQTTLYTKVQQASSGKRINNAEDDPNGAAIVAEYDDQLFQLDGMQQVSIDASARIDATENALKTISGLLGKAQSKAIQAISGSNSPQSETDIGGDVGALQQQVLQLANAVTNGRYLFGGYVDNAAPFQLDGTYSGDANVASVEVGPSLWVTTNVPGSSVLNVPGGMNILGAMGDLVTALKNNDQSAIQVGLDNMAKSVDQVGTAMASLGGPEQTIIYSNELRNDLKATLQEQRAAFRDVDALQAFSDLIQAQSSLQAAIMVSQQVIQSINRSLNV